VAFAKIHSLLMPFLYSLSNYQLLDFAPSLGKMAART